MLVHLQPDDISKWWTGISESISRSLPPFTRATQDRMSIILESLLKGAMDCWVLTEYDHEKDTTTLFAIATTEVTIDYVSNTKNLSIFSLYALQTPSIEQWKDAFDTIKRYANHKNCTYVLGFTSSYAIVELVNKLGGDTSSILIKLEV